MNIIRYNPDNSNSPLTRTKSKFIDQNIYTRKLGNIWNQSLNFIVIIIPNQRVFRTIKKKVNFVFYLIGSTKRVIPVISGSLIVSTTFCHWFCCYLFVILLITFSHLFLLLSLGNKKKV